MALYTARGTFGGWAMLMAMASIQVLATGLLANAFLGGGIGLEACGTVPIPIVVLGVLATLELKSNSLKLGMSYIGPEFINGMTAGNDLGTPFTMPFLLGVKPT